MCRNTITLIKFLPTHDSSVSLSLAGAYRCIFYLIGVLMIGVAKLMLLYDTHLTILTDFWSKLWPVFVADKIILFAGVQHLYSFFGGGDVQIYLI